MGLDMYLTRKKFIGANYDHRRVKGTIDITVGDKKIPIDFNKVSYIEEEVGYWRKANAIHKWFVDNVQEGNDNCSIYYVRVDQLEDLLRLCKTVKEKAIMKEGQIENEKEIAEILPTTDGFFFGSTSYNEYYIEDIEHTIEMLDQILEEENKLNDEGIYSDYYYQSSW